MIVRIGRRPGAARGGDYVYAELQGRCTSNGVKRVVVRFPNRESLDHEELCCLFETCRGTFSEGLPEGYEVDRGRAISRRRLLTKKQAHAIGYVVFRPQLLLPTPQ